MELGTLVAQGECTIEVEQLGFGQLLQIGWFDNQLRLDILDGASSRECNMGISIWVAELEQ